MRTPAQTCSASVCVSWKVLTQAAVWHHDVRVAATLLPAFLAPVLDADGLVCLYNICDLQLWVHLEKSSRL